MNEILTTKLVLVDDQGKPRITMGVSPNGVAELAFTDMQGNERLRLAVSEANDGNDSLIHLCSSNQGPELQLKTSADAGASLVLMRRPEHPLVILEVESGEDSHPLLMMFDPSEEIPQDENGKLLGSPTPLVYLTATEGLEAYIEFLTADGDGVQRLPACFAKRN